MSKGLGRTQQPISSATVEKVVLEALERLSQDDFIKQYSMRDGFIEYESFTRAASKTLERLGQHDGAARVAIKRAVTKLAQAGQIQVRWKKVGSNGWLRLSVAQ